VDHGCAIKEYDRSAADKVCLVLAGVMETIVSFYCVIHIHVVLATLRNCRFVPLVTMYFSAFFSF